MIKDPGCSLMACSVRSLRRRLCVVLLLLFLPISGGFTAVKPADPPDASNPDRIEIPPQTSVQDIMGFRSGDFCLEEVGYGPLRISSQSPFQSLRLGFTPRTPATLSKNKWEFGVASVLANIWAFEKGSFALDYESLHSTFHANYGLTDRWTLELAYDERRTFGGIMDGFISDFHSAFGIDQDSRDVLPNSRVFVDIRDDQGNALVQRDGESGVYSQGILLTLQHNVTCGKKPRPAFAYALTARYELEESAPLERDVPFDFGASVMLSKRFGPVYAYLTGGYLWFGGDQIDKIRLKRTQLSGLVALEWRYLATQSLILQYLASEGQAEDLGPFSDASHEFTLGWKWEFYPGWLFELGLIENFIVYDNSPDFGIQMGLTLRP